MKEEKHQDDSIKSFRFWFMLFGLVTVILVIFFQTLTIASAHSLAMMILIRQMSLVVKQENDKNDLQSQIAKLKERVDVIDPYTEET